MIDEHVEYLQIEPYYYDIVEEIYILKPFLDEKKLQDLENILKKTNIPKSCNYNENVQIYKAIKLFLNNLSKQRSV